MRKMKRQMITIVLLGLLTLWLGGSAVRAILQRVDAIVVIGFGFGAWAAWTLLRMAIAEMREARKEDEYER